MYTRLADRPLNLSEYCVDWVVFDHSVASDSCKPTQCDFRSCGFKGLEVGTLFFCL